MVKVGFYASRNSFLPFKNGLYARRNEFSSFKWCFYVCKDGSKSLFKFELNVETGKITYL